MTNTARTSWGCCSSPAHSSGFAACTAYAL
jgi:hypothetical protein